jgi:hypothetical protein
MSTKPPAVSSDMQPSDFSIESEVDYLNRLAAIAAQEARQCRDTARTLKDIARDLQRSRLHANRRAHLAVAGRRVIAHENAHLRLIEAWAEVRDYGASRGWHMMTAQYGEVIAASDAVN